MDEGDDDEEGDWEDGAEDIIGEGIINIIYKL